MCDITALNVTLLCQNTSGKWSLCSPIWFSKTSLGDSILRDTDGALVFLANTHATPTRKEAVPMDQSDIFLKNFDC